MKTPRLSDNYVSSWEQYTISLIDLKLRNGLQLYLKSINISTMVYYPKPMNRQTTIVNKSKQIVDLENTEHLCNTVLSLSIHPYIKSAEIEEVCQGIKEFMNKNE